MDNIFSSCLLTAYWTEQGKKNVTFTINSNINKLNIEFST